MKNPMVNNPNEVLLFIDIDAPTAATKIRERDRVPQIRFAARCLGAAHLVCEDREVIHIPKNFIQNPFAEWTRDSSAHYAWVGFYYFKLLDLVGSSAPPSVSSEAVKGAFAETPPSLLRVKSTFYPPPQVVVPYVNRDSMLSISDVAYVFRTFYENLFD